MVIVYGFIGTYLILQTERLNLEELNEDRFDDLYKLLSNATVHKYFPKILNKEESFEFLEKVQKRLRNDGYSFYAVIRSYDNVFLGICGLLKQAIDGKEEIEVGYRINDKYWGNGYGTEAARGCMKYAKEVLGKESIISLILPINQQSIHVALKNGMKLEKESMFCGQMHQVYRITFEENIENRKRTNGEK